MSFFHSSALPPWWWFHKIGRQCALSYTSNACFLNYKTWSVNAASNHTILMMISTGEAVNVNYYKISIIFFKKNLAVLISPFIF